MYYLYLCICTSAKCMSVELKVYLFIWVHNFRFSMSLSLSPNSLYRQTTDCTEGGGLTREHCICSHVYMYWFNRIDSSHIYRYISYVICVPDPIVWKRRQVHDRVQLNDSVVIWSRTDFYPTIVSLYILIKRSIVCFIDIGGIDDHPCLNFHNPLLS